MEQKIIDQSRLTSAALPLISAVAGTLFLLATWYLYKDAWNAGSLEWYLWIRPAMMVLAGALCFVATALLVLRKSAGRDVLLMAGCMIPLILAIGLAFVAIRLLTGAGSWIAGNIGHVADGTILNYLSISPRNIGISAIILAVVLLAGIVGASQAKKAPGEKK